MERQVHFQSSDWKWTWLLRMFCMCKHVHSEVLALLGWASCERICTLLCSVSCVSCCNIGACRERSAGGSYAFLCTASADRSRMYRLS